MTGLPADQRLSVRVVIGDRWGARLPETYVTHTFPYPPSRRPPLWQAAEQQGGAGCVVEIFP